MPVFGYRTTENEMTEWLHQLNGPEVMQTQLGMVRNGEAWLAAIHGVVKGQT